GGSVWGPAGGPAASSASFPPPALPRPPACTCAFTTTRPSSRWAMALAWAAVSATSPLGTGTPNSFRMALPWYSWIFMSTIVFRRNPSPSYFLIARLAARRRSPRPAPELAQQPHDRIEVVGHPLLHRDDAVVRDVDVLRADLGAAL